MIIRRFLLILIVSIPLMAGPAARADELDRLGGHMRATVDGREIALPLANSDFSVEIDGMRATARARAEVAEGAP